jgi:hypothetical protein
MKRKFSILCVQKFYMLYESWSLPKEGSRLEEGKGFNPEYLQWADSGCVLADSWRYLVGVQSVIMCIR